MFFAFLCLPFKDVAENAFSLALLGASAEDLRSWGNGPKDV